MHTFYPVWTKRWRAVLGCGRSGAGDSDGGTEKWKGQVEKNAFTSCGLLVIIDKKTKYGVSHWCSDAAAEKGSPVKDRRSLTSTVSVDDGVQKPIGNDRLPRRDARGRSASQETCRAEYTSMTLRWRAAVPCPFSWSLSARRGTIFCREAAYGHL